MDTLPEPSLLSTHGHQPPFMSGDMAREACPFPKYLCLCPAEWKSPPLCPLRGLPPNKPLLQERL